MFAWLRVCVFEQLCVCARAAERVSVFLVGDVLVCACYCFFPCLFVY